MEKGLRIQSAFATSCRQKAGQGSTGKAQAWSKDDLTNPHDDKGSHTIEYTQVLDPKHDMVQEQSHQAA